MPKILIVDDHPLFLDGLRQFLAADGMFEVSSAKSKDEAIPMIAENDFDLLMLDVSMKGGGGMEMLQEIRGGGNPVPVIFLTVHITPEDTIDAMRLGVNGVILKEDEPDGILECINKVLAGETHFHQFVTESALHHSVEAKSEQAAAMANLTAREKEIVALVAQGMRNLEIAENCGLTEGTVKAHLHNIFNKVGVKSRTQLLIAVEKSGSDFI